MYGGSLLISHDYRKFFWLFRFAAELCMTLIFSQA